jgi:hypothetical protein
MTTDSSNQEIKALNISKLESRETYTVWKSKMQVAFKAMQLYNIVDGSRERPTEQGASAPREIAAWDRDDARAHFYIASAVSDEIYANADTTTSASLWLSIGKQYGMAEKEKVYHVYNQICNTKMSSGERIGEHIAKLKSLFNLVESMDEKLSEKFKIAIILG